MPAQTIEASPELNKSAELYGSVKAVAGDIFQDCLKNISESQLSASFWLNQLESSLAN